MVEVHPGLEEGASRALKGEWESEWSVVIHTFGIAMQVTASLLIVCWVSLRRQSMLTVL